MDAEVLGSASDLLFEASIGITPWHDALDMFARGSGASGANVMPIRSQVPGSIDFTDNVRELIEYYFENELYKNCIRARGIPALERKGVMVDKDCANEHEYRTDPYYQEFLRPHGFLWGAYVGFNIDRDLWAVLLHRGLNDAPFTDDEQATLRKFCDQLSVAGTVARKLAHTKLDAMRDAFDMMDVAAVFFDRFGAAVRVNAKAETLLTDGIQLRYGNFSTIRDGDGAAVRRAVSDAIQRPGRNAGGSGHVKLARERKRDLVMKVHRLRGNILDVFDSGWALAILVDPDEDREPDELGVARVLFGLTPAEARIAALLAKGQDLAFVADVCKVTYETARTHLRNIFTKTDTSRQGQLIALLGQLRHAG